MAKTEIWLLMGYMAYEGTIVIGVFSNEEKARQAEKEHSKTKDSYIDGYLIRPFVLDEIDYS